ncbi:MAG: GNAT family N-acetyltransferase [Prochloraceae cyanobacterium]|nr:GNAT family N-acetyltransferase [Prochloraceae cyanobacterium]
MTSQFEYSSTLNSEEIEQLKGILAQCFGTSITNVEPYYKLIGINNFRIVRQGGKVIGGLAIYNMGQWYGGSSVPMAGIAAVGIAPEYRGTGAAYQLMSSTIAELFSTGIPISTLYAATQRLYRKAGYEQAGSYCVWELPITAIERGDRPRPLHRVDPLEYQLFEEIYRQQAKQNNGNLDRNKAIWERTVKPNIEEEETVFAYLIGDRVALEGYIIFSQSRQNNDAIIKVWDWTLLTKAAVKRFWTLLADHSSLIDRVHWKSCEIDPLLLLLPEQKAKIFRKEHWMLRIIDVVKALEKRGYPAGIETELHLEVTDEAIDSNNGRFCLKVSQGRGEVTKGGKGELQIGIRGLASLYTGLFTPTQLQLTGYLQTESEALLTAKLLFCGSNPWMADQF